MDVNGKTQQSAIDGYLDGLLKKGYAPSRVKEFIGTERDGVKIQQQDVYEAFKRYLLDGFDSVTLEDAVARIKDCFISMPVLARTDVVIVAIALLVKSRTEREIIAQTTFEALVNLIDFAPEEVKKLFYSKLDSIAPEERFGLHYRESPFSPSQRLAVAITAGTIAVFPLDSEVSKSRIYAIGDRYLESYDAREMSFIFKRSMPAHALPSLLARCALEDICSKDGIDVSKYEHIFDPESKEFAGMPTEKRNLLARRFMRYLGIALRDDERVNTDPKKLLTEIFGQCIQTHPDFNTEIIEALREAMVIPGAAATR